MTHVLLEIALLPPEDVESMRTEIRAALGSEGGDWNKASLLKMWKIDSALREVGRFYGLGYCEFFAPPRLHYISLLLSVVLTRHAMVGYDLQDGIRIPPGSSVTLDLKRIHFNPQIYPDPERCDLFRFSKLREKEGTDVKYGFATLDPNVDRFFFSPGDHDILRVISCFLS
jgi:Cytochrome P450